MIYFFHHYELPVILQQAQIQDLLMRNQEGGPPLRIAPGQRLGTGAPAAALNNNNNAANNDNNNNNNGGNVAVNRRMTGFNFGGFRFRFGVVLTTHQQGGNPPEANPRPSQNIHGHSHAHQHAQHVKSHS